MKNGLKRLEADSRLTRKVKFADSDAARGTAAAKAAVGQGRGGATSKVGSVSIWCWGSQRTCIHHLQTASLLQVYKSFCSTLAACTACRASKQNMMNDVWQGC